MYSVLWKPALDAATTFAVRDPATGLEVGRAADLSLAEVESAIAAAEVAFADWSRRPADERADILIAGGSRMDDQREEIARILTSENGKPIGESREEVAAAARYLRWSGEEARRMYGRLIPAPRADRRWSVMHRPIGVVAALTPWNFPASMITRKAGPAIAAGCSVVLRPSSATPLTALAIERALGTAGLPEGVFRVVTTSRASAVGELLATDPRIKGLSFTGSTAVGVDLARLAAGTLKRVGMELGGHAPFLIFGDADLDSAIDALMLTKFRNAGQTCIATNRLYVERRLVDEVTARVVDRVRALRIGHGLDETTDIGPLIDDAALERVSAHVDDAVRRGGTVVVGGRRAHPRGFSGPFHEPTVLRDVPPDATIMREETFGPILPMAAFDDEQEAVAAANGTAYGLAAYAFTRDVGRVLRLADDLDHGVIGLNDGLPAGSKLPFGGMKASGIGRELGPEALAPYLEVKAVSIGL